MKPWHWDTPHSHGFFPAALPSWIHHPASWRPPNPPHSGLRAKPANWVMPGMFMGHLGTTFAFVQPGWSTPSNTNPTACFSRKERHHTQGIQLENGHTNQRIPGWVGLEGTLNLLPFQPPSTVLSPCQEAALRSLHTCTLCHRHAPHSQHSPSLGLTSPNRS